MEKCKSRKKTNSFSSYEFQLFSFRYIFFNIFRTKIVDSHDTSHISNASRINLIKNHSRTSTYAYTDWNKIKKAFRKT